MLILNSYTWYGNCYGIVLVVVLKTNVQMLPVVATDMNVYVIVQFFCSWSTHPDFVQVAVINTNVIKLTLYHVLQG